MRRMRHEPRITSIEIQDDLALSNQGAIEVEINCDNGDRRWCYFFTPQGIAQVGDCIPGTKVRIHFGSPYMIVVSAISAEIIMQSLKYIESQGELESCTKK